MAKARRILFTVLVLLCGMAIGYTATVYTLFPVCHGHIWSEAPADLPFGPAPVAGSAHLILMHAKTPFSRQAWYYDFAACDAQGGPLRRKKINAETAGGIFNLEKSAHLTWGDDARSVTAQIGNFACTLELN